MAGWSSTAAKEPPVSDDVASNVTETLELEDPSALVKLIAPAAAIGATWVIRKVLDSGYRAATGKEPPHASDPEQSLTRIILWAAATATAIAVVNVVIDRMTAPHVVD
jgi:hypothetical protein